MNYFLLLIILCLGGGGYYEYTLMQQKAADDQQQVASLDATVKDLEAKNKTLQDDNNQLTKTVADDEAKLAAAAQNPAPATAAAPPSAPARVVPPGESNQLGTISIHDGMTYQDAHLLKVDGDGITVKHAQGISKINFAILPLDLQMRFGYDAMKGGKLPPAQVQAAEMQRKTAGD